ncbi:tubby C-terminal-like domain-containing protein [Aspergillus sergii]|uniref:Tubby C-terminal-like domain-containing protein n=1 Tax=Aspergillus sergii TaxID=1034303 RepID=A0A5N6WUM2_9EURO|nr:tubby C-terminal-like domain-containing protein [Aspergillus sergii]
MSKAYAEARMDHTPSSKPRKALKAPSRPLALLTNHITNTRKTLTLSPQGDAQSVSAYKITDEDGTTLFTASGRKYTNRSCREFRDASGLPLFELHKKISLRNVWSVTLPGSDTADIATGAPRLGLGGVGFGNFNVSFVNVAAVDVKSDEERRVTLEIERHGRVLESFDVVDGDRRVAEVRESIQHNKKLALMSSSRRGYRPALDVTVMEGVDLSLVSLFSWS